jgi:hypothetical protein
MTNLDLSGAIEAGAKAVREYPGIVYAQAHVATPQVSEAVIQAALPHILEALVEKAVRDREENPESVWASFAGYAEEWLKGTAEEVSRG